MEGDKYEKVNEQKEDSQYPSERGVLNGYGGNPPWPPAEMVNEEKAAMKTEECETDAVSDDVEEFDDMDRGWAWVVMLASFFSFFLQGGAMYAVGIVHTALLEKYDESVSMTSWAGGLYVSLCSLAGPVASAVIDRYSCRTALISCGTLCMVGFLGTAFAPTIQIAIFTCGIVAGLGGGLGYTTSMVVVGFNFKKRRSLALGFSVSGVGAGLCALAPLMQYLHDYYGGFGFFISMSAIMFHIVICGMLCFPSKLERHAKAQRRLGHLKEHNVSRLGKIVTVIKPYIKVITNKGIFCLCLAMFGFCLGTFLLYLHLPKYIVLKGFTPFQAASFISLSGILSVFGRFMTGVVSNWKRMDSMIPYAASIFIVSIATFLYPFISKLLIGQIVFVVILGLFFGSCYVVVSIVTLRFVDICYMSSAVGLQFMFGGVGALVGPVCAGVLVDVGGSYDQSIFVAAFCIMLSSIVGASSLCFQARPKEIEMEVDVPTEKDKLELQLSV